MSIDPKITKLQDHALTEIKHLRRSLKQQKNDFLAKFGPQEAKPIDQLLYFERAASALDFSESNLSQLAQMTGGRLPCPICFARTHALNSLVNDVHTSLGAVYHCSVCGFNDHLDTPAP